MTSTISRHDAAADITITLPAPDPAPSLIRPYVTGEYPAIRPVGIQELARLSAGETMVLEVGLPPHVARHAAPTVYPQPAERPERRYRGRHRRPAPQWALLLIGAGTILIAEAASALTMIAFFA